MPDVYEKLNRSIAKQMGYKSSDEEYIQSMADVASHGADTGWGGFTYYNETGAFYDKNAEEIWELLSEAASSMGEKHPLALMATFRSAGGVESDETFKNMLAWFALEEVARWLEAKAEA